MDQCPQSTPFFRLRWTLVATHPIRLPARQGALLYALLAAANQTEEAAPAFPRDLLLDVPEENRLCVKRGDPYHFGGTLLAHSPVAALEVLNRLHAGFTRLGSTGKPRPRGLGGNFQLAAVHDLVGGRELTDQIPVAVTAETITRELV